MISIDQLSAYKMFYGVIQRLLIICDCWPIISAKPRRFKYWVTGFSIVMFILFAILYINISIIFKQDLTILVKSLGMVVIAMGAAFKGASFMWYRSSLTKHHQMLHDLFEEELMRDIEIRKKILFPLSKFYIPTYGICIFVSLTIMVYVGPSLIVIIQDIIHLKIPKNYPLPHSKGVGYFWTIPDGFLYHVHFFFETYNAMFLLPMSVGIDNVFGLYALWFSSILHAMSFRLLNPLPADKLPELLRTCAKKHQQLLQCKDTLGRVFGPICLWYLITDGVLLCALLYEAMPFSDLGFEKALMLFSFLPAKMLETFMYAWYGFAISNASEDFRNAIYCSQWSVSKLDRRIMVELTLMMMQKPLTLRALGFCDIDLNMFKKILNTAVSYFFFLRSVDNI